MLAADVLDDRFVELVACDLDGGGFHHAGQRDHGHIGGAAADVHDHVAVRQGDIDAGADGGCHRFLDQVDLSGASLDAGVNNGTFLDLRDAGGNADDQTGLEEMGGSHLVDEFPQHPLGHVIVGNDAFPQGADGDDVAGGTTQHILCLGTNFEQLTRILINGDHGRFPQDDALALHINQNRSSTQIDTNISCNAHAITLL